MGARRGVPASISTPNSHVWARVSVRRRLSVLCRTQSPLCPISGTLPPLHPLCDNWRAPPLVSLPLVGSGYTVSPLVHYKGTLLHCILTGVCVDNLGVKACARTRHSVRGGTRARSSFCNGSSRDDFMIQHVWRAVLYVFNSTRRHSSRKEAIGHQEKGKVPCRIRDA